MSILIQRATGRIAGVQAARQILTGAGLSGGGDLSADRTLVNTGVLSLTGTANQVVASGSTGAITLSLPQSIHTGASPTFAALTLGTTPLALGSGGTGSTTAADARTSLGLGTLAVLNGAPAGTLTGATLAAGVLASSLTSVGTLLNLTVTNTITGSITGNAATVTTNANLTGHVTSTGNAAVLGSFTSAQLLAALTDETGTGAAVFGTSPVFTTSIRVDGILSLGAGGYLRGETTFGILLNNYADNLNVVQFYNSGGTAFGTYAGTDPGQNNVIIPGKLGVGVSSSIGSLDVKVTNGTFAHFGEPSITAGTYRGISIGYGFTGPTFVKSAIVQEQIGDANARGNIHILNNGAASSANATLADARLSILYTGNVGMGTSTFGTSAETTLGIALGTAPSTSPADMIQLYTVDLSAGNATLGLRTETAVATGAALVSTHSLSVVLNGTAYKIMLVSV